MRDVEASRRLPGDEVRDAVGVEDDERCAV
jgi:hypothetical protein